MKNILSLSISLLDQYPTTNKTNQVIKKNANPNKSYKKTVWYRNRKLAIGIFNLYKKKLDL